MDRVVRHIQFTPDIPLRQIAAQELEHPELPRRQLAILGLDAADHAWPLEGGQRPGQDPRIRALLEDRSRIGYYGRGRLVLAQGSEHRGLAEQRMCHLDGLAKGPRRAPRRARSAAAPPRACHVPPATPRPRAEPCRRPPRCRAPVRIGLPPRPGCAALRAGPARRRSAIDRPVTTYQPATGRSRAPAPPIPRTTRRPRHAHPRSTGPCQAAQHANGRQGDPGPSSSTARRACSSWAPTSPHGKPARSIVRLASAELKPSRSGPVPRPPSRSTAAMARAASSCLADSESTHA